MADTPVQAFFAYPSAPQGVVDTIHNAVNELNRTGLVAVKLWEELRVGGQVVIEQLTQAIDSAPLFMADLTGLNANVMFELGYAITSKKRIWLVFDATYKESKKLFDQFRLLTTIGYRSSANSRQLINDYYLDSPHATLQNTLFASSIERQLRPVTREFLVYLRSLHENEAGIQITKRISAKLRAGQNLIIDDPKEASFQTLSWYGQQVYGAGAVACHLSSPEREGTRVHIARQALVCGMAYGLKKPILILTEGDYLTPLDYRDLSFHYHSAKAAYSHLDGWLSLIELSLLQQITKRPSYSPISLATELKSLQLGEYVAENEAESLVDNYFIETAAYREALSGSHAIFVGRKGSGKTANLYKLASELRKDKGKLVCVIKPPAYQLQSLLDLFGRFSEQDAKGFLIESMWKFLLLTEVAISAIDQIQNRVALAGSSEEPDEEGLIELAKKNPKIFSQDFSVRLEQCVTDLIESHKKQKRQQSKEDIRLAISETLHQGVLKDLRISLGKALSKKERVAILVDNLDKAWDKDADIPELGRFLLGLLSVAGRIPDELQHKDSRRASINCSLAIFLRSDIFYKVMRTAAREPDKIKFHKLAWTDGELLLRVIEERFVASRNGAAGKEDLWANCFCPTVHGATVPDYLTRHILPRPRDIVFFTKAAVDTAINRNHASVEEQDLLDAEKQYSQYAFESILVENGISASTLENILFEFAGSPVVLSESEVIACINKTVPAEEQTDWIVQHLCCLTFLGIESSADEFRFTDDPEEFRRNLILGRKLAESRGTPLRFKIHPAFSAYLEIH